MSCLFCLRIFAKGEAAFFAVSFSMIAFLNFAVVLLLGLKKVVRRKEEEEKYEEEEEQGRKEMNTIYLFAFRLR
jgi:membrane protein implicated in regulation of membrane protease activity